MPTTRIQATITERRGISRDTVLRLDRYCGTSAEFWLNKQRKFKLESAALALGPQALEMIRC